MAKKKKKKKVKKKALIKKYKKRVRKTPRVKKFTKISPKKTFSGVFGSFIFSIISLFIINNLDLEGSNNINFLSNVP